MAELLYADRIRHFNEERRLCASYLKSVTPDARTVHYTSVEARGFLDTQRALEDEVERLKSKEQRLASLFDQKTDLVYKAKAAEDERSEQLLFLARIPPLTGIEKDTTYYYRDNSRARLEHGLPTAKTVNYKSSTETLFKRAITGREAKLEKELEMELREANEIKEAVYKYLDVAETKSTEFTETFDGTIVNLKKKAMVLIDEAEQMDMHSYNTVVELLSLRLKIMRIQREEIEDSERLEREIQYYSEKETSIHMQLNNEVTEMNRKFEREVMESLKGYQNQLQELIAHESRLLLKEKALEEEIALAADAELQQELAAAKARYDKLRRRNKLEMEGFNSESSSLRQRLQSIEKHQKNGLRK